MQSEEENKPAHKGLKKGLYAIPTAFTAANIAMGFWLFCLTARISVFQRYDRRKVFDKRQSPSVWQSCSTRWTAECAMTRLRRTRRSLDSWRRLTLESRRSAAIAGHGSTFPFASALRRPTFRCLCI